MGEEANEEPTVDANAANGKKRREEKEDPVMDQAVKRRKLNASEAENKTRGKRLFGALMGTLTKFKAEEENKTEAAKRRIALEAKLAEKLRNESEELAKRTQKEQETKNLRIAIMKKEDEIRNLDGIYSTRASAKLALSHFLCTSFTPPRDSASDSVPAAPHPSLPYALPPARFHDTAQPLYYLPYKLTNSQHDFLEKQKREVRDGVDEERKRWLEQKEQLDDELRELRQRREGQMEEKEREERSRRQAERRREEEKAERGKERSRSRSRSRERSVSRTRSGGRSKSYTPPRSESRSPSRIRSPTPQSRARSPSRGSSREYSPKLEDNKMEVDGKDGKKVEEHSKEGEDTRMENSKSG